MSKLTKADIDELVAGNTCVQYFSDNLREEVRRDFYLAAGLTAFGAPKPEKVRCWMVTDGGRYPSFLPEENGLPMIRGTEGVTATRGWFVPAD